MINVGIIGAGSWGMALADLLHKNKHSVFLWEGLEENYQKLLKNRSNFAFLKNIYLDEKIKIINDMQYFEKCDVLVSVVPTGVLRSVLIDLKSYLSNQKIVFCNKGIENNTLMYTTQIFSDIFPEYDKSLISVLSGPSHAEEVTHNIPTAIVLASQSKETGTYLQKLFMNQNFRVYYENDIVGVQLGGALKNIIAIAAGIVDGLGKGDNTKAALITRGLAEIVRLAKEMHADSDTFLGLAGIGDIVVTCLSKHSRNRYVGERIGKGDKLDVILDEMTMVAEGVKTTKSAFNLAKKLQIELPITNEIYNVLFKQKEPVKAIYDLMIRKPQAEKNWA